MSSHKISVTPSQNKFDPYSNFGRAWHKFDLGDTVPQDEKEFLGELESFMGAKIYAHGFKSFNINHSWRYNSKYDIEDSVSTTLVFSCNEEEKTKLQKHLESLGFNCHSSLINFKRE